jgi:hypothetical protein
MALDIYVGPLTLYYAGDWENAAQRWARQNGVSYQVVRPRHADRPHPDDARIVVSAWRDDLARILGNWSSGPFGWDEGTLMYGSERPGWDGFSSLVLWAAHAEHPDLEPPTRAVERYRQAPAYLRCTAEGVRSLYSHIVRDIEFWLPWPFEGTLVASGPFGGVVEIGSSVTLLAQLRELNRVTWEADDETLAAWRREVPEKGSTFEALARFGFATVVDLAEGAASARLPMKLDY